MTKPFVALTVLAGAFVASAAYSSRDVVAWGAAGRAPASTQAASSPGRSGEDIYKAACASCHENAEATRAPSRDAMKAMSFQFVNYTLTAGKMKDMGAKLSAEERGAVVSFLTGRSERSSGDWTTAMMCPANRRGVSVSGQVVSAHFGYDRRNTRALSAAQAGLTTAQLADMEPAWAIGFPNVAELRSQGAIVGSTLFYPVAEAGQMYAIDLAGPSPCVQWVYTAPGGAPLRTSAAYGVRADGTPMLVFAGLDSTVHAVDPKTGRAFWTKAVGAYSYSMTTGTPTVLPDRVIVPVAQFEIAVAGDNRIRCCDNHGYVLSLDPKTGAQQWRYDTMEDAKPLRDRGDGQMYYGPSGAPIWNSPVVDEQRGLIYFGTGEANSEPTHRNTDALIAIGLRDGKEKWSFQATGRDIYVIGCGASPDSSRMNCSRDTVFRDVDFGASLILGRLSNGRELLYAGQKSGTAWAVEPDTGKVVWRRDIGTGTALGGIHWGMAFSGDTLYVPIANIGQPLPGGPPIDPALKAGVYALNAETGEIKWLYSPPPPEPAAGPPGAAPGAPPARRLGMFGPRQAAMSTAVSVIDGAVIAGSLDGMLHVIDAKTGKALWTYQTAASHQTVNGVPGKGGSIDSNAITAANGLLLVNSGYGQFGQIPGNVLLAFRPRTH